MNADPVSAYKKFLAAQEQLTADEREALQIGCLYFVETLLKTGDAQKALTAMKKNLKSPWPKNPSTTGKQSLPGMLHLEFEPYETREYIDIVTSHLLRRLHTDGERRVLPWLLQTLKYGFPAERRVPLSYLPQLGLTPEEIGEVLQDVVVSLLAQSTGQPGDLCKHLSDLVTETSDPRWTWQLARALAAQPTADLARLDSMLLISFYRGDGPPKTVRIDVSPSEILELLTPGTHPIARQIVCAYLTKTGQPVSPYQEAIVSRFHDSDLGYLHAAAQYLSEGRCKLTSEQLRIVKRAMEKLPNDRSYQREKAAEAITSLLTNGTATDSATQGENTDGWLRGPGSFEVIHEIAGTYFAMYKNVLHSVPYSEWRTDEEEFGALVIDSKEGAGYLIPKKFPSTPTGASGARRVAEPLALIGAEGEILVCLREPFMNQDGRWGDQNFLYSFATKTKSWSSWQRIREDGRDEIVRAAEESARTSICNGELKLKVDSDGKLCLIEDVTPYHLDSYNGPPRINALPLPRGLVLRPLPRELSRATEISPEVHAMLGDDGVRERNPVVWSTPSFELVCLRDPSEICLRRI